MTKPSQPRLTNISSNLSANSFGPPTIAFYGTDGEESQRLRVHHPHGLRLHVEQHAVSLLAVLERQGVEVEQLPEHTIPLKGPRPANDECPPPERPREYARFAPSPPTKHRPRWRDEIASAGWLVKDTSAGFELSVKPPWDLLASVSALGFRHPEARYFVIAPGDLEAFERRLAASG